MTQFENDEVVLEKIATFKSLGFDQIRISGGTSFNEEHYSGVFVKEYDKESKQMYFLCVPYNSTFHKENDGNGHTKKQGEKPKETGRRESYEETGLLIDEDDLDEIYSYSVPNRRDESKFHSRHFYLAKKISGTLSDFGFKPNPIDGETSSPFWISAKLLKQVLYRGHQDAFKEVVKLLMQVSLEYYDAVKCI